MIDVSIIIPHYNQITDLEKCLRSVEAQVFPDRKVEIIVADNGTPEGLERVIAAFPAVIFVKSSERGAACARNSAMEVAHGKYYAFIDSDCIAAPDWLAEGIKALEDATGDLIGGDIEVSYLIPNSPTAVEAFEKIFGFRQEMYVRKKGFAVTANLFIRARDAKVNGSFTNGLAEDVDWCHRARALGLNLSFHGKALVIHPARNDWGALKKKWQRLIVERWAGYKRKPGENMVGLWIKWIVLASVICGSAFVHTPHILFRRDMQWSDRLGAIKILFRIRFWRAKRMLKIVGGDIVKRMAPAQRKASVS